MLEDFIAHTKREDEEVKVKLRNGIMANSYPNTSLTFAVNLDEVTETKTVSNAQYRSVVPAIKLELPKSAVFKNRLIMLDIIANNHWQRPIYFTGGINIKDEYAWMQDFLQLEGMAYRLVPVKTPFPASGGPIGGIDTERMYNVVTKWYWGNSGDPDIYQDPETLRNFRVIRKNMARLATALLDEGRKDKAETVIDLAVTQMPFPEFGTYYLVTPFVEGYYHAGATIKAQNLAQTAGKKYGEALAYYVTLNGYERSLLSDKITFDLQSFKGLLKVLKDKDTKLYTQLAGKFNTFNIRLQSFGIENEQP